MVVRREEMKEGMLEGSWLGERYYRLTRAGLVHRHDRGGRGLCAFDGGVLGEEQLKALASSGRKSGSSDGLDMAMVVVAFERFVDVHLT